MMSARWQAAGGVAGQANARRTNTLSGQGAPIPKRCEWLPVGEGDGLWEAVCRADCNV